MSIIYEDGNSLLRVIEVNYSVDPRWQAFVSVHPEGSIYHHPLWLQCLEREYGRRPIGLACEDAAGQFQGIMSLLETRGFPFDWKGHRIGHRLSSLPRTPVAGPLALNGTAMLALINAALHRLEETPRAYLELKVASASSNGWAGSLVGVPWRMTYALDLPKRAEDLHFGNSRNHARIKWAVSKAAREGVAVREASTEDDLRAWYLLYLDTMRSHGVPPRSYRFFKICWELLWPKGLMRLLMAEKGEGGNPKILAGSILLMYGQTVHYAFNGRCREALALRPNDAIQWRAIHDACNAGFRIYDFGEVAEGNQGLAEYKSKWDAKPKQLYRDYYPSPQESAPGPYACHATHYASAVWQRLPLIVTAHLGDWLYRFL